MDRNNILKDLIIEDKSINKIHNKSKKIGKVKTE